MKWSWVFLAGDCVRDDVEDDDDDDEDDDEDDCEVERLDERDDEDSRRFDEYLRLTAPSRRRPDDE